MEINYKLALATLIIAAVALLVSAQPPLANESIEKDKALRGSLLRAGKSVATKPKWGFFGTVFNLIVEQINDTKSAYVQISDLVNNQFIDDNQAVTSTPDKPNNGTTETPKITKSEFLKIIDRNLKGLARLRNLEWRESKKEEHTFHMIESSVPKYTAFHLRHSAIQGCIGVFDSIQKIDSWSNVQGYWNEIFAGKKSKSSG